MAPARPESGTGRGIAAPTLLAGVMCLAPQSGSAQPVSVAAALPETGTVAVLDIRDEDTCLDSSLPEARCLPAAWLLADESGSPIGFHALRWLLGTVGLSGTESLAVYAGPDGPTRDAWAVAALVYLAGQAEVAVLDAGQDETGDGWPRSLTREAVFIAPMRLSAMTVADAGEPLRDRLAAFARGQAETVAFGAGS